MDGRKNVIEITTKEPEQTGTGFLVEIERRLFLVTALHVVADARPAEPRWAKSVTAKFDDGSLVEFAPQPIDVDPDDDWVAYEAVRNAKSRGTALATGRACARHKQEKLASYGFPSQVGQAGLTGELSFLDMHVQWPARGTTITRRCLQATMTQVMHDLELPGFSGAPVAVGDIVIGMVSGYLAAGPASGFVRIDGMGGKVIPADTQFRGGTNHTYRAVRTTTLDDDGRVEVIAERLGKASELSAYSTLQFESPDFDEMSATVLAPGIRGGSDELARTAAEKQIDKSIGAIVMLTPIERIVDRLQGIVGRNKSDFDTHAANVRAAIEAKLRSNKLVGPELARGCPDWAPDGKAADRLARSILALDSPKVLAERFATAMQRIAETAIGTKCEAAAVLLDVFELALPVVAGPSLLVSIEKRLYKMSLLEPGVAEAAMAYEDRAKIVMREDPETRTLVPRHYVSLEDQPEYGFDVKDGVADVFGDVESRISPFANKFLAAEGKLRSYPEPTLADVSSVMHWPGQRKFFTIIRRESPFIEELSRSVTELRIILSVSKSAQNYRDMIAPIDSLYQIHREIQRGRPSP